MGGVASPLLAIGAARQRRPAPCDLKPEKWNWGEPTRPGRDRTRLAFSTFTSGGQLYPPNFLERPMSSARARKSAREARALPILTPVFGFDIPLVRNSLARAEHNDGQLLQPEKIPHDLPAAFSQDALWMKLHSPDRQLLVPHPHDFPLVTLGRHFQAIR